MRSLAIPAESGSAAGGRLQPSGGGTESLPTLDSLEESSEESSQSIPLHAIGVKPSGNQYTASKIARNYVGYFGLWPDEVIAIFLEYLDSDLLLRLSTACKFLYAFCRSDDLWKALFIP
jgi:hypothetical protein